MLDISVLKQFEKVVGSANVSDDPTIIAAYSWNPGGGGGLPSERLSEKQPSAVVMPASTEEVQGVILACLRNGLHFRAHSTGNLHFGMVTQMKTVSIDLRRMNRIIDIDVDNQMAIIEPYVTAGDLIVEALKKGLTSHVVGAGWTHSPLASATSNFGVGISGNHTGHNGRNLLAYEWVTPEGEIVRGGSAGSGVGWFAGEGPGPGFRGMLRGIAGATGALGVFTKIGYKLHPWSGRPKLESTGQHPNWGMKLTETERVYQCVWPSWERQVEATYELMVTKAATFVVRIPADQYGWTLALSNRDYYDLRCADALPAIAREENRISWTLMTVSGTPEEAAWRDRTIRAIVEKTGGRILVVDLHHESMIARNIVTSCYVPRAQRGGICGTITSFGISDSYALVPKSIERGSALMAPYKKPGGSFTRGDPEQFWIWPSEGRNVWAENIVPVDSQDEKATADGLAYIIQSIERNDVDPLGNSSFVYGCEPSDMYGSRMGHFNAWMRKIKSTFDPQWAADGDYIRRQPAVISRMWPFARHVFRRSRRLLSKAILSAMRKA